eukprot:1145755-Pelagomonas_calceolata.AAC.4
MPFTTGCPIALPAGTSSTCGTGSATAMLCLALWRQHQKHLSISHPHTHSILPHSRLLRKLRSHSLRTLPDTHACSAHARHIPALTSHPDIHAGSTHTYHIPALTSHPDTHACSATLQLTGPRVYAGGASPVPVVMGRPSKVCAATLLQLLLPPRLLGWHSHGSFGLAGAHPCCALSAAHKPSRGAQCRLQARAWCRCLHARWRSCQQHRSPLPVSAVRGGGSTVAAAAAAAAGKGQG